MHFQYSLRFLAACGLVTLLLAVSGGGVATGAKAAELETFIIGTGKVGGVYFPTAGAICQVVNGARGTDDATCVVVPGTGSKESLEALRAKRTDFAIVQSDWQFWAHTGAEFFTDPTPFVSLAGVFALYAEPLVIAVRRDSGIKALVDLRGKRVSVGSPATAGRGMMEALIGALGWSMTDFGEVQELAAPQQTAALCNDEIDSAVYAVGSPSATLAALTSQCEVSFLPLTGPEVDQLLADRSFYLKAEIPAGIYAGIDAAVPTFGVGATLVTRTDVPDTAVKAVVTAIFENFEAFRALHPALTWLEAKQMAREGLSAPLHPAAASYFANRQGS
ncbi:MAG: TRAP transporter TAXI family solute receptor [Alphaproteobacteria bacterium]|jgi:TRAP transporter TAXI family solute receptor